MYSSLKKIIFILLILIVNIDGRAANSIKDSILFEEKGNLIIQKIKHLYYVNVYGNFVLTSKYLFFCPSQNQQYFKVLRIRLDSIEQINKKYFTRLLVLTKDGNEHMILLNKKRRRLINKIDSIVKVRYDRIKVNNLGSNPIKFNVSSEAKIWIDGFGSTAYSPLTIMGNIEEGETKIVFTPIEFVRYLKTIEIKYTEIKKLKKRGRNMAIIILNSRLKYKFIFTNHENLFYLQQMVRNLGKAPRCRANPFAWSSKHRQACQIKH